MMDFASYAFNKSHAAAYAVVGYQTAFLMRYYPVEMIAAMLNSVMGSSEKVAYYIKFAETQGIQVLPPDINHSYSKFTVSGNTIRFGLAAIKNVGYNVVESIVQSRDTKGTFASLDEFIDKIDLSAVNKRAIESLIKAGALDCFNVYRSQMLAVYEKVLEGAVNQKKRNIDGQMNLFDLTEDISTDIPKIVYPNIKEFNKKMILSMEKEMTGLYISGHPLDEYRQSLKYQTSTEIETINKSYEIINENISDELDSTIVSDNYINDNDTVIIGGIITSMNQKVTRNNQLMAFLQLEDLTGTIEVIVFPKTLDKVRDLISEDSLVRIKGRVSIKEDEPPKLICETIDGLEKINDDKLYILVKDREELNILNRDIIKYIGDHKGNTPVYVCVASESKKSYRLAHDKWVELDDIVLEQLKDVYGEDNVKVVTR